MDKQKQKNYILELTIKNYLIQYFLFLKKKSRLDCNEKFICCVLFLSNYKKKKVNNYINKDDIKNNGIV